MLLAIGPLQLDTTVRTVVVGMVGAVDARSVDDALACADAVWLLEPRSADEVTAACQRGRPVGVTVEDLGLLEELVAAGAVAVESASPGAVDAVAHHGVALWSDPELARRAIDAGVPPERLVTERGGPGVHGATVAGVGPAVWGEVVRALLDGARVVRTTDVRAVRRVAAVTDRLVTARTATERQGAT